MVVFCCKYGTPYGGTRDSEQLRRDTIWGYPEYGASNCVRHMVLNGFNSSSDFSRFHTVHGKSSNHLCASAVGVSSDSVFPSTITHWGVVGKCRQRRSVGGQGWRFGKHREASLIKKEYCRLSASPHSVQVTPPEPDPQLPREGRPIGAHPWDTGGQLVPGKQASIALRGRAFALET